MLSAVKKLEAMKYNLFATEGTAKYLKENGIKVTKLHKVSAKKSPNISEYVKAGKIDLSIVIPTKYAHDELTDGYTIRRMAVDQHIPLIANIQFAKALINSIEKYKIEDLEPKSWDEYKN